MNRRQARRLAQMLTSNGTAATIQPAEREHKHDAGPWGISVYGRLYADPQEFADVFNITTAALNHALDAS